MKFMNRWILDSFSFLCSNIRLNGHILFHSHSICKLRIYISKCSAIIDCLHIYSTPMLFTKYSPFVCRAHKIINIAMLPSNRTKSMNEMPVWSCAWTMKNNKIEEKKEEKTWWWNGWSCVYYTFALAENENLEFQLAGFGLVCDA